MESTKPTLLFIHGYPLNHAMWAEQAALSSIANIVTIDLPGFGNSPAQDFFSMGDYADYVVKESGALDHPIVVGHSMGGYVTLEIAARHPEFLSAVVLMNSRYDADDEPTRAARLQSIERLKSEGTQFIFEAMKAKFLAPHNRSDAELQNQLDAMMRRTTTEGIVAALRSMATRSNHSETLRNFKQPVCVISGNHDLIITPEKRNPNNLSFTMDVEIPNTGHLSMMEEPDTVNDVLSEFLENF